MALEFAICAQCDESHARQANGRMSIHTTAAGERCAPPARAAPQPKGSTPQRREAVSDRRADDDELQAAFEVSRTQPRRGGGTDAPDKLDRRIYVTERAEVVRGGLPTISRRGR